MKKCLRCGMTLADKAIRCPQCNYEIRPSNTKSRSSSFRVLNLSGQKIGVLFPSSCRVIDTNNEPLFSYEKGKLINLRNKMVFTVNPAGTIDNSAGKPVGSIENYQQFLSVIHRTSSPTKQQTSYTNTTYQTKTSGYQQSKGTSSSQQSRNTSNGPGTYLREISRKFDKGEYFDAFEISEKAYSLFPNNVDVMICYAAGLNIQIALDEEAYAYRNEDYYTKCKKLFDVAVKLKKTDKQIDGKKYEEQAHHGMGRYYDEHKNYEAALKELSQVDIMLHPYDSTVITGCHMQLIDGINRNASAEWINKQLNAYGAHIKNDTVLLKRALTSKNFNGDAERAAVLLCLSLIYAVGYPHVPKNVNYAYDCVRQAYSLRPAMAEEEYRKYKKGIFGVTYSG